MCGGGALASVLQAVAPLVGATGTAKGTDDVLTSWAAFCQVWLSGSLWPAQARGCYARGGGGKCLLQTIISVVLVQKTLWVLCSADGATHSFPFFFLFCFFDLSPAPRYIAFTHRMAFPLPSPPAAGSPTRRGRHAGVLLLPPGVERGGGAFPSKSPRCGRGGKITKTHVART